MENRSKKIHFGANTLENVAMGVPGENGPLGFLMTSRQPYSRGVQQTPQDTLTTLVSGLGRSQCEDDRLKRALSCYLQ